MTYSPTQTGSSYTLRFVARKLYRHWGKILSYGMMGDLGINLTEKLSFLMIQLFLKLNLLL